MSVWCANTVKLGHVNISKFMNIDGAPALNESKQPVDGIIEVTLLYLSL